MNIRNFNDASPLPSVGVIPTDTVYGVVARISDVEGVERIYKIKKRSPEKALIVLIGSFEQLNKLELTLTNEILSFMSQHWPSKLSVVIPCDSEKMNHIHRGAKSLSVRMPPYPQLLDFLIQHGPFVAPSANPQGLPPATNLQKAYEYFGENVDYYIDGGERESLPSTIIQIKDNEIEVLREGAVALSF